jgi:uncharacterized repeat protein (TIGR01451 family)
LLLTDSAGTVRIGTPPATPVAMTQRFDSGAATKIYEFGPYTIPAGGPTGGWTARVVAAEGSEGTVTDFAQQGLVVTLPSPALTFLKFAQVERDPVNGTTAPKAIPGADVLYTLQVSNSGPGGVDSNTLVLIDPIPANTRLFVGDLGQGGPVTFSDADADSGFAAPPPLPFTLAYYSNAACSNGAIPAPDADGFDAGIRCLRITMTGAMNGAVAPATPDFTLTFRARIE